MSVDRNTSLREFIRRNYLKLSNEADLPGEFVVRLIEQRPHSYGAARISKVSYCGAADICGSRCQALTLQTGFMVNVPRACQ